MGAMLAVGHKNKSDISQITLFLAINLVLGFVFPGIDWRAHLGGLATGIILSVLLKKKI
jgi:membrane associated rhomboid family serine protease